MLLSSCSQLWCSVLCNYIFFVVSVFSDLFADFLLNIMVLLLFLGAVVIMPEIKYDGILKEERFQSLFIHIERRNSRNKEAEVLRSTTCS